ncbi:putative secreted salivary protein [Aphelenchoides besseyi]|nr:putative secreted salivary protein [Aphelenchoides besseyi]
MIDSRILNVFVFVFLLSGSAFVEADPLDAAGRKACLSVHNQNRRALANGQVQNSKGQMMPKATDMIQMKYSEELAKKSQAWAEKCVRKDTGGQATLIKKTLSGWWDQVKNLDSTDVQYSMNMFMKFVSHFAQMAYSKNTAVGCAVGSCDSGSYIVCNYDQKLQFNDQIYKTGGEPCTACDPSRKFCQRGLCSKCSGKSS